MSESTPAAALPPAARSSGPLERIILTGFMGSGKTTVGALLAARLHWEFVDLDDEIVRRTGRSVAQLFADRGEDDFRREESAALADVLPRSRLVLSLGGGVPESAANRELLRSSAGAEIVFLRAEFSVLHARCAAQATEPRAVLRPLFEHSDQAHGRLLHREPLYRQIANREVNVADSPAPVIVETLLSHLRARIA